MVYMLIVIICYSAHVVFINCDYLCCLLEHSQIGPKRDEVIGGWRKLHNEELHNLCSLPSIIRMIKSRRMRMGRACSTHGEKRNACRILMGKPEGRRPLERPRRRLEDNIKMDL
jgi:hypothetical protein